MFLHLDFIAARHFCFVDPFSLFHFFTFYLGLQLNYADFFFTFSIFHFFSKLFLAFFFKQHVSGGALFCFFFQKPRDRRSPLSSFSPRRWRSPLQNPPFPGYLLLLLSFSSNSFIAIYQQTLSYFSHISLRFLSFSHVQFLSLPSRHLLSSLFLLHFLPLFSFRQLLYY